jgi:hypothetical protein
VCCHNGLADFSKTQAQHPNAQRRCWLRAARRTRMKKPRRSGAKSGHHSQWARRPDTRCKVHAEKRAPRGSLSKPRIFKRPAAPLVARGTHPPPVPVSARAHRTQSRHHPASRCRSSAGRGPPPQRALIGGVLQKHSMAPKRRSILSRQINQTQKYRYFKA